MAVLHSFDDEECNCVSVSTSACLPGLSDLVLPGRTVKQIRSGVLHLLSERGGRRSCKSSETVWGQYLDTTHLHCIICPFFFQRPFYSHFLSLIYTCIYLKPKREGQGPRNDSGIFVEMQNTEHICGGLGNTVYMM